MVSSDESQEGENALLQQVNAAFSASMTQMPPLPADESTGPKSSDAPFDAPTLQSLLRPLFGPYIQITTISVNVTTEECQVIYAINKSPTSGG